MFQKCCNSKKIYDVYTSCIFSNCSVFENGCIHINAKKKGKRKTLPEKEHDRVLFFNQCSQIFKSCISKGLHKLFE